MTITVYIGNDRVVEKDDYFIHNTHIYRQSKLATFACIQLNYVIFNAKCMTVNFCLLEYYS